jgi:hypothetical protein
MFSTQSSNELKFEHLNNQIKRCLKVNVIDIIFSLKGRRGKG